MRHAPCKCKCKCKGKGMSKGSDKCIVDEDSRE
jgi:hypothetical protein